MASYAPRAGPGPRPRRPRGGRVQLRRRRGRLRGTGPGGARRAPVGAERGGGAATPPGAARRAGGRRRGRGGPGRVRRGAAPARPPRRLRRMPGRGRPSRANASCSRGCSCWMPCTAPRSGPGWPAWPSAAAGSAWGGTPCSPVPRPPDAEASLPARRTPPRRPFLRDVPRRSVPSCATHPAEASLPARCSRSGGTGRDASAPPDPREGTPRHRFRHRRGRLGTVWSAGRDASASGGLREADASGQPAYRSTQLLLGVQTRGPGLHHQA